MSDPKLVYSQITSEPPLVAGETVTLFLVISNPPTAAPVTVTGFEMVVPPSGTCADELSDHVAEIVPVGPAGWQASPQGRSFLFTPPGGSFAVEPDGSLTLQLTQVEVNNVPGPVKVKIFEGTPDAPQVKRKITKAPPGFVVGPLTANPVNCVDYPGSTSLSWVGSDDPQFTPSYTLQWIQHGQTITKKNLLAVEPGFPVTNLKDPVTAFTLYVDYTVNGQHHSLQRHASVSVPVPVNPPVITSFSGTIHPTESGPPQVTFFWETTPASLNVPTCALSANPGVALSASSPPGGMTLADPGAHFGATLIATNKNGSVMKVLNPHWVAGAMVPIPGADELGGLALSRSGKQLYLGTLGGVALFSATGDSALPWAYLSHHPIGGGYRDVADVSVSPDGTQLYCVLANGGDSGNAGAVQALDSTTFQPVGPPVPVSQNPTSIAIDGAGERLYVNCVTLSQIDVLSVDQSSPKPLSKFGSFTDYPDEGSCVAINPLTDELWLGCDGSVKVFEITNNPEAPLKESRSGSINPALLPVVGLAFAPNGESFIAATQGNAGGRGLGQHSTVDFSFLGFGVLIDTLSGLAIGPNSPDIYTSGALLSGGVGLTVVNTTRFGGPFL